MKQIYRYNGPITVREDSVNIFKDPSSDKVGRVKCKKCGMERNAKLMPECKICEYKEFKMEITKKNDKEKREIIDYSDGGKPLFEYKCKCGETYLSTGHLKECEDCRLERKLLKKKK